MKILSLLSRSSIAAFSLLLAACDGINFDWPPLFAANLHKYAVDNITDVPFTITVYNSPSSVTCFDGGVTMSNTGTNEWSGTADYVNQLTNRSSGSNSGINTVTCTGTNINGTITSEVGKIELIPNHAPVIVMLASPINICGNNGSKQFNETLVSPSSTYMAGATYSVASGSLPPGLAIDPDTGKLIGTIAAGDTTISGFKMRASTLAGTADSTPSVQIKIYQAAACP